MRSDDIHPGDVIAGKYRVRAIISRTPTLLVEAFHVEFDQRVVIKLLLAGTGDDKEIERFRREARVLSKLESEHAARVIDVGTQQDGAFFMARQHVDGEDLATYVQSYGPRPLAEAVLLVLQAAECVAETHAHGIVLRELSPASLVVARRPSGTPLLKITDFGTAKLARDSSAPQGNSSLTATALFGLSPYSSPELVRKAKSVDQRADVWSLGAVLYFLLAGKPPFNGDVTHLMLSITREEPAPVTTLRGDLPPDIDTILAWAMAKDVDRRFKNVHSFAHALAPYAPSEGQVLVERIGQIAHQAKQRKSGSQGSPVSYRPPPPSMPSRGYGSVLPPAMPRPVAIAQAFDEFSGEDEATVVLGGKGLNKLRQEITQGMGATGQSQALGQGFGGLGARGIAIPPPPPSIPPSPYLSGNDRMPRLVAPISASSRRGFAPPLDSSPGSHARSGPPSGRSDTVAPSTAPVSARSSSAKQGFDMRIVWGALAATTVMLPMLLLLLLREGPPPTSKQPLVVPPVDQAAAAERPTPGVPPEDPVAPAVQLTAEPAVPPTDPTVEPRVAVAPVSPNAAVEPRQPPTRMAPPPRTAEKKEPPPKKPPKEDPPAASGGKSGRLLAIASGGSCAFSVDGAGRGSGSSLSVSLPAGSHTVACKPSSGSAKSRSVTIKPDETSMLTFKL